MEWFLFYFILIIEKNMEQEIPLDFSEEKNFDDQADKKVIL